MPSNWKTVKLGELFEFKNGLNKGVEYFGYGTPIVNYMDVNKRGYLTKESIKGLVEVTKSEAENCSARKGDVFFTRTSETLEEIGLSSVLMDEIDNCVFSGYVLRARPKTSQLIPKFCAYSLRVPAIRKEIMRKSSMTTRALTNGRFLSEVEFSYPEVHTQKTIVNILEAWDNYLELLSIKIGIEENIRNGFIQQLLTGEKRLNGFTSTWIEKKINEVFDFLPTHSHSKEQMSYKPSNSNAILNIHYGDIHTRYADYIDISKDNVPHLTDPDERIDSKRLLKEGDLVVADASEDYSGIGSCVEILKLDNRKCIAGLHTFALRSNKKFIAPGYAALVLKNKHVHNWMKRVATYSKVYGITKSSFGETAVYLPPIQEQEAISNAIYGTGESIRLLKEKRQMLLSQRKFLVNNLVSGKIPVPKKAGAKELEAVHA